ncbi:hypothetical protein BJX66DRAFT_260503 [Aspergillus keveii]|uniref:C2H2-type domain-containing protein n=1 Tax=Aspergillus keveii TaxID=714993 RepID=A0ABR4GKI7_9EURO
MIYPSELYQSSSSQPPSSSSSSNNAAPRTLPAYSSISRPAPTFPFPSIDTGLGISYCDMGLGGDHMRQYQPSEHDSADWLGQMMPVPLPYGCSLNTTHLSPATFYDPYSGSDTSASPLSYCGPQTMSASPSRGPELDYGTGHDMTNTHAYNFWPSTPRSEPDVQVKEEPGMEYRDESHQECAKPSIPISAPDAQLNTNDLPVRMECFGEMGEDIRASIELEVGRDSTAEPSMPPSEIIFEVARKGASSSNRGPPKIPPASGLTCTVCGAEFTRRSNCREHMKKHDPNSRKLYSCEDCGKTLGRKTDLKRHIDSVHRGIRRFGCDQCGFRFSRHDTLARHVADGCRRSPVEFSTPKRRKSNESSRRTSSRA